MTLIAGGLPGSETIRDNRTKTRCIEYKIELHENGTLLTPFRTQAEFAIPMIRAEAEKAQSRLEKMFPDRHYEIKELF